MCFVEFEDVQYAARALNEMYGHTLNGLIKNGIRLSYSKNPLGVRSPSMSNPSGVGNSGALNGNSSTYQYLHESSGRAGSVDAGRFGIGKGSFFEPSAPPRRQQQQRDEMMDNRIIGGSAFDGGVIGPRTTRHMSLGPGNLGSLGDFVNNGGLGTVPEHTFGNGMSGLSGNAFLPATSPPPSRLPPRYFSPDAIGSNRGSLSPTGASSAFSSLAGLGGSFSHSDLMNGQQSAPRSTFSPFRNDVFTNTEQRFDERERFERADSLPAHFHSNNIHDSGLSTTLYTSNALAPLGSNNGSESR